MIDLDEAVATLIRERPSFHTAHGEPVVWNALPGTLRLLARRVRSGDRTLETGAGASTVVFAAAGSQHLAISPHTLEHERIGEWCSRNGIETSNVRFCAAFSTDALPIQMRTPLDLVFIDGGHSFPVPVVDWYFAARRLRVGGTLVLDDVPIPAVLVLHRFMTSDPAWEVVEIADNRAVAYRKLNEEPAGDDWRKQPFNRAWPDYRFLPVPRRMAASLSWWLLHRMRQELGHRLRT